MGSLVSQALMGETPKSLVHQREQLVQRASITVTPLLKELGDI
jgi:hypothetical protein